MLASLALIATKGFAVGIDFKGGSILEVTYQEVGGSAPVPVVEEDVAVDEDSAALDEKLLATTSEDEEVVIDEEVATVVLPTPEDIRVSFATLEIGEVSVQPTSENGYILRTAHLQEEDRRAFVELLNSQATDMDLLMTQERFNTIGPTIGAELRSKAWIAIATVIVAIILFIAYIFREVSEPVSSWRYGFIAIVALIHDIAVPAGIVSLLSIEIDSLFVIALLAILGLSVNDTIVVFDRVRENLRNRVSKDFAETVGKSLEQTFTRSINTSITTLFVVLALFFVGPDSIKDFSLVLAVGLIAGTYSSIFLASPLLVEVERRQKS